MLSLFGAVSLLALGQKKGAPQKTAYQAPVTTLNIKPPATRFSTETPLPGAPSIVVDRYLDAPSYTSAIAKSRGLQARIIWIDGTANIDRVNTEAKIDALVAQIKDVGFNTIVFDVKPISGQTLYPSKYAPKITAWRGAELPADFDPLKIMARDAKAAGLTLIVSLNAFSEGHQLYHVGPGYDLPDEQSVVYQPKVTLRAGFGETFPCDSQVNVAPTDASELGVFNDPTKLPKSDPDEFAVTVDQHFKVVDGFAGGGLPQSAPTIPSHGAYIVGKGIAADFLRRNALPNTAVSYEIAPYLIPTGQIVKGQIPLMMNPNDAKVQARILDIVREVVSEYPIDGIIFDDRLRYTGLDGDFSDETRRQFETFVGHSVNWPTSIYSYNLSASFSKGIVPGPDWDAWLAFRALTVRNFLGKVKSAIDAVKPQDTLSVYAGSWYGEYAGLGSNWASPTFEGGFWDLTPAYRQTGFADLVDMIVTGCYYQVATVHQAMAQGVGIGATVEAAGALSNRAVDSAAWCVAGISLDDFRGDPQGLMNVLSAACATTQGVMVFDLSHHIDEMWPTFKLAFSAAKKSPISDRVGLNLARNERAEQLKHGKPESPVIILNGSTGVGQ